MKKFLVIGLVLLFLVGNVFSYSLNVEEYTGVLNRLYGNPLFEPVNLGGYKLPFIPIRNSQTNWEQAVCVVNNNPSIPYDFVCKLGGIS